MLQQHSSSARFTSLARSTHAEKETATVHNPLPLVNMTRGDFCILCRTERDETLDRVGILFHRFPRAGRHRTVDRWTEVLTHAGCLVPDKLPVTAALCSLHFDADQYTFKLVRSTGEHKRILRKCSVPTQLLRNNPGNKEYPMRRIYNRRQEVAAPKLPPTQHYAEVDSDDEPQLVMDIPLDEDENSNMSQPRPWTPAVGSSSDNLSSTSQPNNVMPESVQLPGYYNNPPQHEKTTEVDPLSVCDTTFSPSVDVQPETYQNTTQQDTQLSADIQIASYYSLNQVQQKQMESNAVDLDIVFLSQQVSNNTRQEYSSNLHQMPTEMKRERLDFTLQDFEERDMNIAELAKKYFHLSQNALEAHSTEMMKLKETLQTRENDFKTISKLNNKHEVQVTKLTNFYRNLKQQNAALQQALQRLSAPCEIPNCQMTRHPVRPHPYMREPANPRVFPYNRYPQYPSPALPSASSTTLENNYSPFIPQSRTHPYLRQPQSEFSNFQRPAISQTPSVFNPYNPLISKTNPSPYTHEYGYAGNFHLSNLQRNNFNIPPRFELPYPANGYQYPQTPTTVPSFQDPNTSNGYQSPQNSFAPLNSASSIHNSTSSSINHDFQSPSQIASGAQSPQNGFAPLNNTSSIHNNSNSITHGFQTPAQSPNTANGFGPIVSPNIPTQSGYLNPGSASSDSTPAVFSPSHNSNLPADFSPSHNSSTPAVFSPSHNSNTPTVFSPSSSPNVGYNSESVSDAAQHSHSNDNSSTSNSAAVLPSQSEFPNNSDYSLNVQVNEYQSSQQTVVPEQDVVKSSLPQQTTSWVPPVYQPSSNSWSM